MSSHKNRRSDEQSPVLENWEDLQEDEVSSRYFVFVIILI